MSVDWVVKNRFFCRVDQHGCAGCGGRLFEQREVINEQLAATWELTGRERALFDEREGHQCRSCGLSKRVRLLLWCVRRLLPDLSGSAVLHLNQVNGLSRHLRNAGRLVETFFNAAQAPGSLNQGLVNQDLTRLTFPDDSFDLVIHSETVEHIHDFTRALEEARRVLKPGGYHLYTVPLIHRRRTRRRILMEEDGTERQLLPLSTHGSEGEFPVVWEFGGDFLRQRKPRLFRIFYDNYFRNKTLFTVAEHKTSSR
jgi:SAM-dependent methyltransferase